MLRLINLKALRGIIPMIKFLKRLFHIHDWEYVSSGEHDEDDMEILTEDMSGEYKCRDCSKEKEF